MVKGAERVGAVKEMTVTRQTLRTGSAVVGFSPAKIGDESKIYVGTRYTCPPTNSSPVYIGPESNNMEYEIWPGQFLELRCESSAMWAHADDLDQRITWCRQ